MFSPRCIACISTALQTTLVLIFLGPYADSPFLNWLIFGGTENGRYWPVLAGPPNFFFSKRRAPHRQEISITWMRTEGLSPQNYSSKKYFLEKIWDFTFSWTGQDRPRPARTGHFQWLPLFCSKSIQITYVLEIFQYFLCFLAIFWNFKNMTKKL